MMQPILQHIRRPDIHTIKWDACISGAGNGLIYAQHQFLDQMAGSWEALVMGDYEAVMPLCRKRKWGISYLFQPPFTQQLGVFYREGDASFISAFLHKAFALYPFAEMSLNYKNPFPGSQAKNNYILDLSAGYARIEKSFKADLQRNLRVSGRHSLQYGENEDAGAIVALYQDLYAGKMSYPGDAYTNFSGLCAVLKKQDQLVCREVIHQGQLVAGCICLYDGRRLYLVISATVPEGRKLSANHFLLNELIREFSGQEIVLDFEGSDIGGIAHFYENFGAVNQPYYFMGWNRLPWPLKLVKPSYSQFGNLES